MSKLRRRERASDRLLARIRKYETLKNKQGMRKPGSRKK